MDFEEKYNKVKAIYEKAARKRKIRTIIITTISVLAIAIVLVCYLILNKDFTYNLNGESESFIYKNMILNKSDNYYYLTFGELSYKNDNIQSIDDTTIMCNDRLITGLLRHNCTIGIFFFLQPHSDFQVDLDPEEGSSDQFFFDTYLPSSRWVGVFHLVSFHYSVDHSV